MKQSLELKVAIEAARKGGKVIAEYFTQLKSRTFEVENKVVDQEGQGLVSIADLDSEIAIVNQIKKEFPSHSFLGEESHSDDLNSDQLWVIDPLDGTNNFAHGIPHFAVSIAYYEKGQPVCGAILNPVNGDIFTTQRDSGAWANGSRVVVNEHKALNETMVAVGFYYDRGEMMRCTLRAIEALFESEIHGIRRMGTAALDLVQVGLGRLGGYFEYTLSPWDFAAARLFVEEAGGKITTCNGKPLLLEKSSVLASNGLLHEPLLNIVSKNVPAPA